MSDDRSQPIPGYFSPPAPVLSLLNRLVGNERTDEETRFSERDAASYLTADYEDRDCRVVLACTR